MNPGGLIVVAIGGGLIFVGAKLKSGSSSSTSGAQGGQPNGGQPGGQTTKPDITSGGGPGSKVDKALGAAATMGVQPAANAATSLLHHFVQTHPVKPGGPAPHDPAGRETIGGKTYRPVKNAKGNWVWELLHPGTTTPAKAPKKVAKTPPKTLHTKTLPTKAKAPVKTRTLPTKVKAPTGLLAI